MSPQEAAQKILAGQLVVFPTETVYGLGALASDQDAVRRIFEAKGRPAHNPLILHIADHEQLDELVHEVSPAAKKLIDCFWPGPLTICFKKKSTVSDLISGGLDTVCVRRPSHPLAHEFLTAVGKPVAAPSANISGKPSTTTSEDARKQLESKGVYFLDGGKTPLGIESTIVDCSGESVVLLRPGSITMEQLEQVLGEKVLDASEPSSVDHVRSPGQLLEHYAPQGELFVLYGSNEKRKGWMDHHVKTPSEWVLGTLSDQAPALSFKAVYFLTPAETDLHAYAAELYAFLNWCDQNDARHILLELPGSSDPLLPSLLNRLKKASRGHIISV
ncbi:MAG: L-threonylcarbamoyladenylate synthase [Candidatus Altimarinota bacterium]